MELRCLHQEHKCHFHTGRGCLESPKHRVGPVPADEGQSPPGQLDTNIHLAD